MAGLFAQPHSETSKPVELGRQALFVQLKAICVPLLEATRAPTVGKNIQQVVQLLSQLRRVLEAAPKSDFTLALANYVFFPLSSLLRPALDGKSRGDAVLEATMLALESLVQLWRRVGMEARVRQELWIMTILTLGGPLDPSKPVDTKGKGKAVETTEEAQLAMVSVLLALMRPTEMTSSLEAEKESASRRDGQEDDKDPLGERLDWSRVDPRDPKLFENGGPTTPSDPPPPTPILFHTLTTLLALASEPTSLLALQLSSLEALRLLISHYLAVWGNSTGTAQAGSGPSPLLATALPGSASTLSRIVTSRPKSAPTAGSSRPQGSSVIVSALETLSLLIRSTVGDVVTEPLRMRTHNDGDTASVVVSLEDLTISPPMGVEPPDEASLDSAGEETSEPSTGKPKDLTGPTIPTPEWLRYTLSSLDVLFTALSPTAAHDSPVVRAALVRYLDSILVACGASLGQCAEAPLEGLLVLAGDDWHDQVGDPAREALVRALSADTARDARARSAGPSHSDGPDTRSLVLRIVQRRFAALPGTVRRRDELAVRRGANIVRVALSLFADQASTSRATDAQLLQNVEKWSWNLLSVLELERVAGATKQAGGGMALAWITGAANGENASTAVSYPPTRLRGITDETTIRALDELWRALGCSAAQSGLAEPVVEHLLGFALGPRRQEAIAVSSLWALDQMLVGMKSDSQRKEQRKLLRNVARALVALLDDLRPSDNGQSDEGARADSTSADVEKEPQRIEHRSGVLDLPSLEAYKPVATREAIEQDRATQQVLLTSWSLRLLATCANLLGSAFQPLLMQSLYHVLEHSSPTSHPFVAVHAQQALVIISDSTAYASPQNLVLANVDYVVNSVSQRLAVARLDPSAPLVLVEMIRLVGKPIVPMVQDLVDDVFEALDDYHGYEEVTVGLWAVLDALLKVMEEDLPEVPQKPLQSATAGQTAERDWQTLATWLDERTEAEHSRQATEEAEEVNPQRPFERQPGERDERPEDPTTGPDQPEFPSDQVAPPTRTQVVTAQILSKALYFLSHESPFLRARVLSLIASAVPLLSLPDLDAADPAANRTSDLMPVIHRAWPYILNRLSDHEPYVVVEAAGLVESLARNVGDYMSRRIVDDVWPRFKTLLGRLDVEDRKLAISTQDRHSTSFRIYSSILQTLRDSAESVQLKEEVIWEQAMCMRRFLSVEYHSELQTLARALYRSLGRLNPDLVWLVLAGAVRSDPALPSHLAMDERSVGGNVRELLAELDEI
ncbi:hypothetical protein JCM10908_005654 [Rhodotorula pacifica]|uniref:Tti1p n=1 Tax=Rhodotorula pacifica TaxID=1495444 RepID=UPI00316CE0AC